MEKEPILISVPHTAMSKIITSNLLWKFETILIQVMSVTKTSGLLLKDETILVSMPKGLLEIKIFGLFWEDLAMTYKH